MEISITATPTVLFEEEETPLAITLTSSEPVPSEGIIVRVSSDVDNSLEQFNLPATQFENVQLVGLAENFNGFQIRLNQQTGTITVPVADDSIADSVSDLTFNVEVPEGYIVDSNADSVTLTIEDSDTPIVSDPNGGEDIPSGAPIPDTPGENGITDGQNTESDILLTINPNNPTPPGPDFSGTPAEYAAALVAKEISTRVFGANGDPQSTLATEATLIGLATSGFDPSLIEITIDEIQKTVSVSHPGLPDRTAIHTESQGSIILPVGVNELAFTPQTIEWLGPPEDALWPLGEIVVEGDSLINRAALAAALDNHIERTGIRAITVVHEGELVGERYAPEYGAMVPQRAWSTGKSVAATAIGRMIEQGYLELDQQVPVEAWANDERQEITIRNLLNMSSGLDQQFDRSLTSFFSPENEHTFIYVEGFDTVADAVEVLPGAFAPGTEYAYRNANPLIATAVARLAFAEESSQDELAFLAREVFEPLGMRSSFVETDLYGNFLISGAFYSTARDLARLALVHLQDGMFAGERVLSEEWTNFVYQPSPGLENFGAYWRNNVNGLLDLPTDAFFASGGFGQRSIAIPSRDLVIAQLAFDPFTDDENFEIFVNEVVDIVDAIVPVIEPDPPTNDVETVGTSGDDTLIGDDRDNNIDGDAGNDTIFGRGGDDAIDGGSEDDRLFGGDGNDTINGGSENDRIAGNAGDDILTGGSGEDRLFASSGTDILDGGSGDDRLFGGDDRDILIGNTGHDFLNGGDGDDVLMGVTGRDVLVGGDGADLFVFGTGDGQDLIRDFEVGIDKIGLVDGELTFSDITITQSGTRTLLGVASTGEVLAALKGVDASSLTESSFEIVPNVATVEEAMAIL